MQTCRRLGVPFTTAHLSDLLEGDGPELAVSGDTIAVDYAPFELITIAVPHDSAARTSSHSAA